MADESFKVGSAYVELEADDSGLEAQARTKVEAATADLKGHVGLEIQDDGLREQVRGATEAASADQHANIGVEIAGSIERLREEVKAAALEAEAGQSVKVDMHVEHMSTLADIRAGLDDLASATDRTGASVDDLGNKMESTASRTRDAGNAASSSGNGFLGMSGKVWALVGAVSALGPVLAALPALTAGVGAAFGEMLLAGGGVAGALKDVSAQQSAVGQSGAQLAATEFANSVAIRNGQQAIADARRQAAQATISSAEQIANAQQAVGDAERQAAQSAASSAASIISAQQQVANATYQVTQANLGLTDAEYNATQAQKALTQAQQDAANSLADANNAAADAHLQVEQATLNVAAAERALTAANGNSLLTADQRAQADLNLRQAQQGLVDAKQRDAEASQKAAQAQKAGVDQAPAVLAATHQLQQAVEAVAAAHHGVEQAAIGQQNAERGLETAQRNAADQQIATAESIANAQQRLADAQRNAANQQIASQEAVQKAVQSLADTQKQQQLAAAAASASGSAAATKYAKDFAKLTPAGQTFVTTLLGMKGALHDLENTAQTATLPGFTSMLTNSKSLLPVVNTGVHDMGVQLGTTAAAFGHLFANSDFDRSAQQFTDLITHGFGQFASALPPLLNAIVTDGVKAGPLINAVAAGVHDLLATGLPNFLSGLAVNSSGAAEGIGAVFRAVTDLLGPVGTLTGGLGGALGPALAELSPEFKTIADEIVSNLMPLMPQLSTDLVDVADAAVQIFRVLEPLIPIIAHGLGDALSVVDPLLRDTAGFLHDNQQWLTPLAGGILLVIAAMKTYNAIAGIGEIVTKNWAKAAGLFGSQGKIATTATKAWQAATSDLASTLGTVVPIVGGVVGGAIALGQWLGSVGQHAEDAQAAVTGFTGSIIALSQGSRDAGNQMDFLAVQATGAFGKLGGGGAVLGDIDTALANLVASGHADEAAAAMTNMSNAVQASGHSVGDLTKLLPKYNQSLGDAANETRQGADAAARSQTPFSGLALHLDSVAQAAGRSAQDLQDMDKALHGIDQRLQNQQALDDYQRNLNNIAAGAAGATRDISGTSQAAIDNRDQLDQAVQSLRHMYDSQVNLYGPTAAVNQNFQNQVDALRAVAEKTYGSKDAVDKYLASLGLIPASKATAITVDDSKGRETITKFMSAVDSLHPVPVQLYVEKIYGPGNVVLTLPGGMKASTNADGGPVRAGEVSWVGEEGPELVQFDAPGHVIPNDQIRRVRPGSSPAKPAPEPVKPMPSPTINLNYYGTQQPTPEQRAEMMRDLALLVR